MQQRKTYVNAVQFVHTSTPKDTTALSRGVPASEMHVDSGSTDDVQVPLQSVPVQSVTPPRLRFWIYGSA